MKRVGMTTKAEIIERILGAALAGSALVGFVCAGVYFPLRRKPGKRPA